MRPPSLSLNAPYDAPCFLTVNNQGRVLLCRASLNAPYGAPYSLTCGLPACITSLAPSLNAPYGAPCFLTLNEGYLVQRIGFRS